MWKYISLPSNQGKQEVIKFEIQTEYGINVFYPGSLHKAWMREKHLASIKRRCLQQKLQKEHTPTLCSFSSSSLRFCCIEAPSAGATSAQSIPSRLSNCWDNWREGGRQGVAPSLFQHNCVWICVIAQILLDLTAQKKLLIGGKPLLSHYKLSRWPHWLQFCQKAPVSNLLGGAVEALRCLQDVLSALQLGGLSVTDVTQLLLQRLQLRHILLLPDTEQGGNLLVQLHVHSEPLL